MHRVGSIGLPYYLDIGEREEDKDSHWKIKV